MSTHVAGCAVCASALGELERLVAGLRSPGVAVADAGDGCLDEMAVARIAEGGGRPEELAHLVSCAECRTQVAEVAGALTAGAVAMEAGRLARGPAGTWRRRLLGAGAAAAAIALTVLLARTPAHAPAAGAAVYRDSTTSLLSGPTVVAPVDAVVRRPVELRWKAAPEVSQYRVTVFDAEGSVMWEGETGDTRVALPAAVTFTDGVVYWWRVEARVGFDRWAPSELTAFSVGRAVAPDGSASGGGK